MTKKQRAWVLLFIMIFAEVTATTLLPFSEGFTRPIPTALAVSGYIFAIYLLSHVTDILPASIAYAVWAGLGTTLVMLSGLMFLDQVLTAGQICGIVLVVTGVILINRNGSYEH